MGSMTEKKKKMFYFLAVDAFNTVTNVAYKLHKYLKFGNEICVMVLVTVKM